MIQKLIEQIKESSVKTPFYLYDKNLLKSTLIAAKNEAEKYNFKIHFALKSNTNDLILEEIKKHGFGADCVSGGEIKAAMSTGFPKNEIVFAGVGKSDDEINLALENDIFCFNCESSEELTVINELAHNQNKIASIALRINPNVNANTHHYITTGLDENKFGINLWELGDVIEKLKSLKNLNLIGLHFHIGSQITDMEVFRNLCNRVNYILDYFNNKRITISHINLGGGFGIDYKNPDDNPIPNFAEYFKIFNDLLERNKTQQVHFELGRALVGQCGSLISKVLYVKNGVKTNFVILDAGMTDLIRPALYQAYHKIENLTNNDQVKNNKYDVVGPICESSDCFGKAVQLPLTKRGDLFAIRSAGAYGEVMVSNYNLRENPKSYLV